MSLSLPRFLCRSFSTSSASISSVRPSRPPLSSFPKVNHLQPPHYVRPRPIVLAPSKVPLRTVPLSIPHPPYADPRLRGSFDPRRSQALPNIEIKSKAAINEMRRACELASYIREYAGKQVQPGISTEEIDRRVHEEILRLGVYPSPLHYAGFPKSCCTSINQVVCHGIPDDTVLEEGDILNIDVSVFVNGYHGDCSGMFIAGKTDPAGEQLVRVTREALDRAIDICGPGVKLNRIGETIESLADEYRYSVVKEFCGHGIGKDFHMPPFVFHFRNPSNPVVMKTGMTFTIEPMLNEGSAEVYIMEDDWTVVTRDGRRSAQFEETIAITDNGVEILTKHK